MKRFLRLLIAVLPTPLARRLAMRLASASRRLPMNDRDQAALDRARRLAWGPAGEHVAYAWGVGQPILLVHGWGGGAAQMAPLAEHLAWLGFRAIAPDLTGHGASPGRRISFAGMTADLSCCVDAFGMPAAVIAHSAGAMTTMAARRAGRVQSGCWVLLNPPLFPYPPIDAIRKALKPPQQVLDQCQEAYCAQFGITLADGQAGVLYADGDDAPMYVLHDADDDKVSAADGDVIMGRWPAARRRTTEDLGHQKTLWNEAVVVEIGDFISTTMLRSDASAA